MASPKFPIVVKQGSVTVKIYRTPSRGCEAYTLSYYQDGVRKRPTFTQLQAAKDEARIIVNRLGNADTDVLTRNTGAKCRPGAETAKIEGWPAFAWKHNALRHSFISYRVADIQNVAQVALEAGNSPQMIFKHYRELVRPAEAKAWFGLMSAGKN
jgi:hypothetical protein